MISINELALAADKEFGFLQGLGFPLAEWSEIFPESFKGGFKLVFRGPAGERVVIRYIDLEFSVRAGKKEIFGPNQHEPFAENTFSREHLVGALPKIRESIQASLSSFASRAK